MTSETIIQLEQVGINFGSFEVHQNINFRVQSGEVVTLLGPSGAGKTLILKMIIGLLRPSKGQLIVLGKRIDTLPEDQLRLVRKEIGMLFQGAALFDSLTVYENIAYPLREYGGYEDEEIDHIVHERLSVIGLPDIAQKMPSQLSGGQKKRVGLARALASSPKVILFDEPTTGLDPTATRLIDDLILRLKHDFGITCLAVTHDIASARRISDRWLLVNKGRISADGPVAEISQNNQEIIDFISGNWRTEVYASE